MNNSLEKNTFPLKNLLEIISKQHNAFKYQTGSFIDIIHYSDQNQKPIKNIKLKLEEIYLLTCKVSKLLDDSHVMAQGLFQKKDPVKVELKPKQMSSTCKIEEKTDFVFENEQKQINENFFDHEQEKSKMSSFILDNSLIRDMNMDNLIIKEEPSLLKKNDSFSSFLNDKHERTQSHHEVLPQSSSSKINHTNIVKNKKIKKRGHYKICSLDIKMEAIRIARIKSIKESSEMLKIPEKNIKRWIKNGPERKKGAGRKTMDPDMEKNLLSWVAKKFRNCGVFPDNKEIKLQAKIFSTLDKFKASKGWCDKFLRRNFRFFEYLKNEKSQQIIILYYYKFYYYFIQIQFFIDCQYQYH